MNLRSGYLQDIKNDFQQKIQEDMIAMIGLFIKDATELAGIFCIHLGLKSVTVKDIELGLKTRAYYGDMFWNTVDIQQKSINEKFFE